MPVVIVRGRTNLGRFFEVALFNNLLEIIRIRQNHRLPGTAEKIVLLSCRIIVRPECRCQLGVVACESYRPRIVQLSQLFGYEIKRAILYANREFRLACAVDSWEGYQTGVTTTVEILYYSL